MIAHVRGRHEARLEPSTKSREGAKVPLADDGDARMEHEGRRDPDALAVAA